MKTTYEFLSSLIGAGRKTWFFAIDFGLFISAWFAHLWGLIGKDIYESTFLLAIIYALMAFDFALGFIREWKKGKAETKRSLLWVFKFLSYTAVYFAVTALAAINESKYGWLPTGVSLPMVLVTLISVVKNLAILNVVPMGWAEAVLKNIDAYKLTAPTSTEPPADNGERKQY